MIHELSVEKFLRQVVGKLEELEKEVVLQNPNTSTTFPCYVVQTPLIQDKLTEDSKPLKQRIQLSVEQWANKKYDALKMLDLATKKLRELNFTVTNMLLDTYDDVTKKYRIAVNYEVNYNALYNSLERVR